MYSALLLDHFQNPRNAGELPPPAIAVEAANPACGDIMRLSVSLEAGKIREVRFKAKGCTAAIACGSALTELVLGKSLDEAAKVSTAAIAAAVGGLPSASGHAAVLASDALKAAVKQARECS